jgi:hypothetical protein
MRFRQLTAKHQPQRSAPPHAFGQPVILFPAKHRSWGTNHFLLEGQAYPYVGCKSLCQKAGLLIAAALSGGGFLLVQAGSESGDQIRDAFIHTRLTSVKQTRPVVVRNKSLKKPPNHSR